MNELQDEKLDNETGWNTPKQGVLRVRGDAKCGSKKPCWITG